MKLIISSHSHGQIKHDEIELPDRFLGLSIELANGSIFQIDVADDEETSLEIREATFRSLSISPRSANTVIVKGI